MTVWILMAEIGSSGKRSGTEGACWAFAKHTVLSNRIG